MTNIPELFYVKHRDFTGVDHRNDHRGGESLDRRSENAILIRCKSGDEFADDANHHRVDHRNDHRNSSRS
ncbi:hypothetical protein [Bradyrhizobium sp. USDA 223]|uniref:hypothetical protein n=1 Tax=Bradyrhizobium sp. USDA 223 TaxID=3156306 RepID=UPI003850507B